MEGWMSTVIVTVVVVVAAPTVANRLAKLWFLVVGLIDATPPQSFPVQQSSFHPAVAIHVAISNEDPAVVLGTLTSLDQIEYSNYHVVVIDNNTSNESLWQPVEAFCVKRPNRFTFHHVERLDGYKAGALNFALERTPQVVEIVAIIDADTVVDKEFLSSTVPYFADTRVAIVQSPLGFQRDPSLHRFSAWVYLIYRYFLSIYMPAADHYERAPFIGAMGLIRRRTLESCGGWNGFYLTEDMEISGRIFRCGYISRFVNHVYGRSMPPADFMNFKRQHYRWSFGNAQIFRDHLPSMLGAGKGRSGNIFQRLVYFVCPGIYLNVHLIPFALAASAIQLALLMQAHIENTELCCKLMLGVLGGEILGDTLMFAVLGASERATWMDRLRNLAAWWGLSLNNARSTWAVLFCSSRPFEVTQKGSQSAAPSIRTKLPEMVFGIACLVLATLPVPVATSPSASSVLGLIGALVLTSILLPISEKENGS